jgi:hypothetical protein
MNWPNSSRLRERITAWTNFSRQSLLADLYAIEREEHGQLGVGVLLEYPEQEGDDFTDLEGGVELTVEFENAVDDEEVGGVFLLEEPDEEFVDDIEHVVLQVVVFKVEACYLTC